ncbi:dTDP-4-dehydrorhamnose 3,5-epimerase [Nodosilinea sp. E11]|uniref:dTDP-4-dehydrorhamnose 3,5-epimerase n=1 Tax=Nodosilinea sp. E11 TaxID=3037479 RepID=UPI002934F508|nr:dTDP-4-dehydrorhamnose 3,5-epimerase [Nodosilinea sp. E11]WOD40413.1 dTDP-4-dehydrorhamnose 3,5-epimerase [Nodosilinea sp. E11]
MKVKPTPLSDVHLLEPRVFQDQRGFFMESFNQANFCHELKLDVTFVQDNHSCSGQSVLRGLHYQIQQPQGKLVRVLAGAIFDVAVDIRRQSPTFGQWVGYTLSAQNFHQLWVPAGFAHGFLVLSEVAEVLYKATDYYAPDYERCILWNDSDLGIDWPLDGKVPILSEKDQAGHRLKDAEVYA